MSVKGSIYLIANVVDKKSLPVDGPQLLFWSCWLLEALWI
jgi:hypothetical protein